MFHVNFIEDVKFELEHLYPNYYYEDEIKDKSTTVKIYSRETLVAELEMDIQKKENDKLEDYFIRVKIKPTLSY